jgi:two-component system, cell cycle response regulator DivK
MAVDFSKITALAIEDDVSGGAMIGMMMRRLGIRAYVDSTGDQVIELARNMDPIPDIIFLDLNLPLKSGFEILKEIRADDKLKDVLVIAVTAMDAEIAIPKCKQAGFDGYIAKPLRLVRFNTQVANILSGKPVWDAS